MDSALSVIQGVLVTLKADSAVTALLAGRIYTDVPQGAAFPYLVISIDTQAFAANDFSGQEHTLRLQAFSQANSAKEVLQVRKAALDALDRKEAAINVAGLVKCEFSSALSPLKEDDGKTWQAIGELDVIVV